jgi:UDP-N-acetylmuramyl pentapeptide phosphotransferase/UDP-N-acetylglucosamine-1-phosphate transferase
MNGDTREIKEVKSSNIFSFIGGLSFVAAVALSYFAISNFIQNITVSKTSFVCTKIEQIGKNMDDVRCVQYTHQKFSQDAVTLNMMVK